MNKTDIVYIIEIVYTANGYLKQKHRKLAIRPKNVIMLSSTSINHPTGKNWLLVEPFPEPENPNPNGLGKETRLLRIWVLKHPDWRSIFWVFLKKWGTLSRTRNPKPNGPGKETHFLRIWVLKHRLKRHFFEKMLKKCTAYAMLWEHKPKTIR